MPSSPPLLPAAAHILPGVRVDRARFEAASEEAICFAPQGPMPGSSTTVMTPDGALGLRTTIAGTVSSVSATSLVLDEGAVSVRTMLPAGVDLRPWVGHSIRMEITVRYRASERPTVEAIARDDAGGLLLWARDGALPDRGSAEARVRIAWGHDRGPRLVVATDDDLATACAHDAVDLRSDRRRYTLLALRVDPHAACFVLVRR